jgi:hypothetical protein
VIEVAHQTQIQHITGPGQLVGLDFQANIVHWLKRTRFDGPGQSSGSAPELANSGCQWIDQLQQSGVGVPVVVSWVHAQKPSWNGASRPTFAVWSNNDVNKKFIKIIEKINFIQNT